MSLSVNPVTKFLNDASAAASKATNAVSGFLGFGGAGTSKSDLDNKVSRASGGAGVAWSTTAGAANNSQRSLGGASSTNGTNGSVSTIVGGFRGALGLAGSAAGVISNAASDTAGVINALTGGEASSGGVGSGILAAAGQISAAAGVLNNILSRGRGKNLPSGAELFEQTARINLTPALEGDWRVRLNCDFDTLFGAGTFPRLGLTRGLVFPFTPNMNISSKANYSSIDPVHSNFPFQAYKNSQVDDITISGDFPAETSTDGEYYLEATMFLRSATKMFYGEGAFAGNPPIVCTLSGYGPQLLNNIPVVVKSFQIELKDDVNYIEVLRGGTSTWVPVLSSLTVTLMPVYNRERLRKFSLQNFAAGKEVGLI
jgi:hypothetical protein